MEFHGIYDTYEMYDLQSDPDDMHNVLGSFMHKGEGGTLDGIIRKQAPPEIKAKFDEMNEHLMQLLKETGARPEPLLACPR